ncbi:YhdT family protein [Aquibacillus sediminis]|uniref:YhdT family protein n=1 Tax=Aquibacillus sediminis TaxID=2574734 RepID=UPI001109BC22|nr:YhdT family protein [Aquibacillus sediminis]
MSKKKDPRFKIANREALIGVGLAVFNFVWWFAFAYGLGSKSPENYQYILGLPAWFFYSCVLGLVIMVIAVSLIVKKGFVDVPFEDEEVDR